jgi:hypothetical protein
MRIVAPAALDLYGEIFQGCMTTRHCGRSDDIVGEALFLVVSFNAITLERGGFASETA